MLNSLLNKGGAVLAPRLGLLALLGLTILSTLSWNGCSKDAVPTSSPEPSSSDVQMQIEGYDTLPPEAREKVDLVMGTLADITSEVPARVDAGFARLNQIQPGLYDEFMAGLNYAFNGDGGSFTLPLPIEVESRSTTDGGPKICTKITVEIKITIKKGSKFCYESGGIEHCTELDADTVFTFTKVFTFECDSPEGCEIEHSSTSTTRVNKKIKHQGADGDGNGTPDVDVDVDVKAEVKVKVEVTTCP